MIETEMVDIQEWKGHLLYQLMKDCEATGVWDGKIRNGYVTTEQRITMEGFSPNPDVQIQLFLQRQAGVSISKVAQAH